MSDNLILTGQLEIDRNRGVIYFHSEKGYSALRICGLKKYMNEVEDDPQIDITICNRDVENTLEDMVAISINNIGEASL